MVALIIIIIVYSKYTLHRYIDTAEVH